VELLNDLHTSLFFNPNLEFTLEVAKTLKNVSAAERDFQSHAYADYFNLHKLQIIAEYLEHVAGRLSKTLAVFPRNEKIYRGTFRSMARDDRGQDIYEVEIHGEESSLYGQKSDLILIVSSASDRIRWQRIGQKTSIRTGRKFIWKVVMAHTARQIPKGSVLSLIPFVNIKRYLQQTKILTTVTYRESQPDLASLLLQPSNLVHKTKKIDYSLSTEELPGSDFFDLSQKRALKFILDNKVAFVRGSPGSGKTMLACEVTRLWLAANPHKKVLVCAESESSVDRIWQQLSRCQDLSTVRFVSPKTADAFESFSVENLRKSQVMCCPISEIMCSAIKSASFDFVVIDDARRALLVPTLGVLLPHPEKLCLFGDKFGLKPQTIGRKSVEEGLGESLFDVLNEADVPTIDLSTQYRMHPSLWNFSNSYLYELTVKSATSTTSYPALPGVNWPNPNFRLTLFEIQGQEIQKGTEFINQEEATVLSLLVGKMITDSGNQFHNIGVITPYQSQRDLIRERIEKIPTVLKKMREEEVTQRELLVDTLDNFQGAERDTIIVSTVHNNRDGFLGPMNDIDALNLISSRARYGMVVIANTQTLSRNKPWSQWLKFVENNNLILDGK